MCHPPAPPCRPSSASAPALPTKKTKNTRETGRAPVLLSVSFERSLLPDPHRVASPPEKRSQCLFIPPPRRPPPLLPPSPRPPPRRPMSPRAVSARERGPPQKKKRRPSFSPCAPLLPARLPPIISLSAQPAFQGSHPDSCISDGQARSACVKRIIPCLSESFRKFRIETTRRRDAAAKRKTQGRRRARAAAAAALARP